MGVRTSCSRSRLVTSKTVENRKHYIQNYNVEGMHLGLTQARSAIEGERHVETLVLQTGPDECREFLVVFDPRHFQCR